MATTSIANWRASGGALEISATHSGSETITECVAQNGMIICDFTALRSGETITINTDFVSEDDTVMFEELTNSPEIYILDPYKDTVVAGITTELLNEYITPVRLKSSNFTKKTIANDRLMQYKFEVEKSRTLRTQSV